MPAESPKMEPDSGLIRWSKGEGLSGVSFFAEKEQGGF